MVARHSRAVNNKATQAFRQRGRGDFFCRREAGMFAWRRLTERTQPATLSARELHGQSSQNLRHCNNPSPLRGSSSARQTIIGFVR